jgi:hypothetical protein
MIDLQECQHLRATERGARPLSAIMADIRAASSLDELAGAWNDFWRCGVDDGAFGSGATCFLLPCLRARNARSVLCVGNGLALEAHALVYAGFTVDVLDISSTANRMLQETSPTSEELERILGGRHAKSGGCLTVHTGDFRAADLCPGPYDVVIARRMLQYFPTEDIPSALEALHARLAPNGLLVLESQNARNTRKAYFEWLKQCGFAVYPDLQVRGKNISAPSGICAVRTRPVAWVMSSTG